MLKLNEKIANDMKRIEKEVILALSGKTQYFTRAEILKIKNSKTSKIQSHFSNNQDSSLIEE